MTVPDYEAPANYVPAAAVIRRGKRYPDLLRKGSVDGEASLKVKTQGSTPGTALETVLLECRREVSGIPSVAVKCVDIRRNTSGEGGLLDDN